MTQSNRFRAICCIAVGLLAMAATPQLFAHCKGKHQTDWPRDGSHDYCEPDSGGGGGGDSGADVKMICVLYADGGNNVLPDRTVGVDWNEEDTWYVDGLEKVVCDTGGTSQPNLSGINLNSFDGGNTKNLQRKINFEFDFCPRSGENSNPYCIQDALDPGGTHNGFQFTGATGLANHGLMGLFRGGTSVSENAGIAVRPYKSDNNGGAPTDQDHIQLLKAREEPYPMAVRLILRDYSKDTPRVVVNLAGHSVLGDNSQGVLCDIPDQTPALTQDANVYVNESGMIPRFKVDAPNGFYGALCTNIAWDQDGVPTTEPEPCGKGAEASRLCNFHGLVKVKFTMEASAIE